MTDRLRDNPEATSAALLDLLQDRIAGAPSAGPILTTARFRPRASTRRDTPQRAESSPTETLPRP